MQRHSADHSSHSSLWRLSHTHMCWSYSSGGGNVSLCPPLYDVGTDNWGWGEERRGGRGKERSQGREGGG